MIRTVPNMLTAARLLAAPGIAVPFMALPRPEADLWALGIFLAAAATDFLDGWLARRLGQESALGRVLDPIADKAMVVIALAVLLALSSVAMPPVATVPASAGDAADWSAVGVRLAPWIALPAVLILLREILVSGLREALGPAARLEVTGLAKWKTAAQMLAIAALLAERPIGLALTQPVTVSSDPAVSAGSWWIGAVAAGLLWIAAALTVITGWDYAAKALRYIRRQEDRA